MYIAQGAECGKNPPGTYVTAYNPDASFVVGNTRTYVLKGTCTTNPCCLVLRCNNFNLGPFSSGCKGTFSTSFDKGPVPLWSYACTTGADCRNSNDISYGYFSPIASVEACQAKCEGNPNCFSFEYGPNSCYLKGRPMDCKNYVTDAGSNEYCTKGPICESAGGAFIKAVNSGDIFWATGSSATSEFSAKYHVRDCKPCPGIDACGSATPLSAAFVNGLPTGSDFTCSIMNVAGGASASCYAPSTCSGFPSQCAPTPCASGFTSVATGCKAVSASPAGVITSLSATSIAAGASLVISYTSSGGASNLVLMLFRVGEAFQVGPSIASGLSSSGVVTWTVPSTTAPGSYFVQLQYTGILSENADNTKYITITAAAQSPVSCASCTGAGNTWCFSANTCVPLEDGPTPPFS